MMSSHIELYRTMYLIRRFEEQALAEFSTGKLVGTTHAYIGQEANAVGVISNLNSEDVVWSNHRCHGHFLAYGGEPAALAAELMGKSTGIVGGRGGSQHIHWKNFFSNGIQGGIVPNAAGMALSSKIDGRGSISAVFIGDGTLGQGVVYETMNIAALWQLPILFVVENNHFAQTTPVEMAIAGSIVGRFEGFGINATELFTSDVLEILPVAEQVIGKIRSTGCPAAIILNTHRFMAHSKGDDTRDKEMVKKLRQQYDPLQIHGLRLDTADKEPCEAEVNQLIDAAFFHANSADLPSLNGRPA